MISFHGYVHPFPVFIGTDKSHRHPPLVLRILFQLLADMVLYERCDKYRQEGRRHTDHQHRPQLYPFGSQQILADQCRRGRTHRTAGDTERGRYHAEAQRTLRTYLVGLRNLRYNRQQGIGCMGSTCHDTEQPADNRPEISNVIRMIPEKPCRYPHKIVQTT